MFKQIKSIYESMGKRVNMDTKVFMSGTSGVRLYNESKFIYLVYDKFTKRVNTYMNHNGSLYYIREYTKNLYMDINNIYNLKLNVIFDPGNNIKDDISTKIIMDFNERSDDEKIVAIIDIQYNRIIMIEDCLFIDVTNRLHDFVINPILEKIIKVPFKTPHGRKNIADIIDEYVDNKSVYLCSCKQPKIRTVKIDPESLTAFIDSLFEE